MVGASAAACAQNLVSASFTGTFTAGWTFASTGVKPNGTSAFMNTQLNPANHLIQNNTHLSFYSRTIVPESFYGNTTEIGTFTGPSNFFTISINKFNVAEFRAYRSIAGASLSANPFPTTGFFAHSRLSTISFKAYKNNNVIASTTTFRDDSISVLTSNVQIGGVTAQGFSTKECAFASIGDGLDDTEVANFYTAVQAFQTTLNRQV